MVYYKSISLPLVVLLFKLKIVGEVNELLSATHNSLVIPELA